MKKLIKYTLLAFSICTATVACAEFDDTEIWDSIKDLQERVSQLEKDVQKNVEALQSMISVGSVQSCTFDAARKRPRKSVRKPWCIKARKSKKALTYNRHMRLYGTTAPDCKKG